MRPTLPSLLFLALVLLPLHLRAGAPDNAEAAKEKDIRKLLELTGASNIGQQTLKRMLDSLAASMPQVPKSFWQEIAKEANAEAFSDRIVPVYARHLGPKEVKDLLAFFSTPTGRKYAEAMPKIAEDSMQVGGEWGEELSALVLKRLREEGYTR